jgi:glycosyltransferase involved in cell wall biosynthesis
MLIRGFIKEKINIIRQEATTVNVSFISILFKKSFSFLAMVVVDVLNLLLMIISLPLFLLCVIFFKSRYLLNPKKKKIALFVGLEHVIDKTCERGKWLEGKGIQCIYFSYEWSGVKCSPVYNPTIIKYTSLLWIDSLIFLFYLFRFNPCYVEMYFEGKGINIYLSSLFTKLNNSTLIAIERGSYSFNTVNNTITYVKKQSINHIFKLADKVFYREQYMLELLKKVKFDHSKLFFDHNKVRVKEEVDFTKKNKNKILFLNSFTKDRRIDLLIKAIKKVAIEIPAVKLDIVGARNEVELKRVEKLINSEEVGGFVKVYGWTTNPREFYDRSAIYVLLSEYTFCNFSLIEAMERGLPAIVLNVEYADKVVINGVNGFLCEENVNDIASKLISLLSGPLSIEAMGQAAREKVKKDFNSAHRMDPVYELIKNNI